jgi:hypothetical protein
MHKQTKSCRIRIHVVYTKYTVHILCEHASAVAALLPQYAHTAVQNSRISLHPHITTASTAIANVIVSVLFWLGDQEAMLNLLRVILDQLAFDQLRTNYTVNTSQLTVNFDVLYLVLLWSWQGKDDSSQRFKECELMCYIHIWFRIVALITNQLSTTEAQPHIMPNTGALRYALLFSA